MMKNMILIFILLTIILIFGCAPVQQQKQPLEQKPTVIEAETDNVVQEGDENEDSESKKELELEKAEISDEVKELLSKSEQKVQSISYKYKGPETADFFYQFYIKDNKIRYILNPTYKTTDVDEDAYDSIYIDNNDRVAESYCTERDCNVKGKKDPLDYEESYIKTPFDWLDQIVYAEKLGEELIDKRKTIRLSTDNAGIVWVDTFFGVPLQVEYEDNKYRYTKMTFNDVKDENLIPS